MICKKCGKEIKDGDSFCTYCGTPVNGEDNNKGKVKSKKNENDIKVQNDTKKKSNKLKIIIPIIVVVLIIICIVVVIILKNKNNGETNTNEVVEEQQQDTSKIEIGTNYNCVTYGVKGYINFNTETSYVMNMTYDMSESVTYNGTYKRDGNTITLTVTYYDMAEDPETFEPYTETINILEDGTLKYTSSDGATYIFDKNVTLSDTSTSATETSTGDLLEQIYAKYPSLEGTEGIICTDGTDYWLLDESGDKVYFTDLNSFEEALAQCNIDVNNTNTGSSSETKIDINRFVKELSYGSTSTVNNGDYPGDGYRTDYFYYDEDLTLDDFTKTEEGNNVTYSITTTKTRSVNYGFPITLAITITKDNMLKEIKITAKPKEWEANEILQCSKEVEAALGYAVYNQTDSKSIKIVDNIKDELISNNYIESKGNYKINVTNKTVTKKDATQNKTVTFTIGTDTLTYDEIF